MNRCSPHVEHVFDRPEVEAPRGVEPTGTNGRTRHTFRPACWVGSRPVVVSFVGWQGALFSCGHGNDTGEAFGCSRPLSGSRTATTGIGRVAGSVAGRSRLGVGRYIGFAVVMAQVRRPVPFRTRKLRPGRGDGTALERVWESSTPPHSTLGVPVERDAPGTPFLVCLLVRVSRDAREAPNPQHPCIAWSVSVTVSNDVMRLTRYARAGSRESRYDGKRQKPDN